MVAIHIDALCDNVIKNSHKLFLFKLHTYLDFTLQYLLFLVCTYFVFG